MPRNFAPRVSLLAEAILGLRESCQDQKPLHRWILCETDFTSWDSTADSHYVILGIHLPNSSRVDHNNVVQEK